MKFDGRCNISGKSFEVPCFLSFETAEGEMSLPCGGGSGGAGGGGEGREFSTRLVCFGGWNMEKSSRSLSPALTALLTWKMGDGRVSWGWQ